MKLNELTRERLTDDRTYKEVKDVAEGLTQAGRLPACDLLRYIKLAEYEQAEEEKAEDEILPTDDVYFVKRWLETR